MTVVIQTVHGMKSPVTHAAQSKRHTTDSNALASPAKKSTNKQVDVISGTGYKLRFNASKDVAFL